MGLNHSRTSCKFHLPPQTAAMANSLYHSLQGQYFVGYSGDLHFTPGRGAWAALYNPKNSGVDLYVNVWTVSGVSGPNLDIGLWLNAALPGTGTPSPYITAVNAAIRPQPQSKMQLLVASDVPGSPKGSLLYKRITPPGVTLADEEDGKIIVPPGENFAIFITGLNTFIGTADVRVALGWWEEKRHCSCKC